MKQLLAICLFVVTAIPVFGQGVEQTLIQLEKDWSQVGLNKANLAKDVKTMERIIADDWVGIDYQGKTNTRAEAIANLKSGSATTQSIELGPMKVRVFGDTAIVNGSDTEKSTYKGKDSSGKYAWTDTFVNRNGKWQAVSSQSTKLP